MKKIVSLFIRNFDEHRQVSDQVVPSAKWVTAGEGIATVKYDGTCCLIKDGQLFKRYDAKHGKTPPPGFIPAQDPDPITGHWPGWLAVGEGPEDRWHREAWDDYMASRFPADGTYELIGPKINGGREKSLYHLLLKHGGSRLLGFPRDFSGIKNALSGLSIEGVVWHHPDGRMVKIKRTDFGLPWPVKL